MQVTQHTRTEFDAETELLERTWAPRRGFFGWFTVVNQSRIGMRYILTAFVFFLLAGIQAILIRTQLSKPENDLLGPDLYNQLFTMHGVTMMFLFAIPVMEGFATYVMPLMIGTRDMCFPRLNAFGYYVYLIGGVLLYIALFLNLAPDVGWFSYPPLASADYSPSARVSVYATLISFIEVSAIVAALEIIVTVFKQRAPGMSLNRMPLFVWSVLIMSFMIIFAMPAVMAASIMLAVDRSFGMHFFSAMIPGGNGPLLWQHLFWFFGHPEVYIIFVPALGMLSAIVVTFARRPVFGYTAIVLAQIATGFLGFSLWVHHMFTTGLPQLSLNFFTAASMMIAIPTSVQIFCWIATLWMGRPRLATPLLFVIGFFFIFVLGGLTGVMIASVPFDAQVHDTFFIVAHFHYVLIGGAVFPLLGAVYYWFPKMTGRLLNDRAGKWSFWLAFTGFNIAFFPMHSLGLMGMPRRVYTYVADLGWGDLNLLATLGAYVLGAGILVSLVNVITSLRTGVPAGDNPWGADTLEWATSSPPPNYNFRELPVVRGLYPLWDLGSEPMPVVEGIRSDRRQVLITSVLDARPEAVANVATASSTPFLLALAVAVAFAGFIFTPWAVVAGFVLVFIVLAKWHWPGEWERTPPWKERTG